MRFDGNLRENLQFVSEFLRIRFRNPLFQANQGSISNFRFPKLVIFCQKFSSQTPWASSPSQSFDVDSPAALDLALQPYEPPASPGNNTTQRAIAEYGAINAFIRDAQAMRFYRIRGGNGTDGRNDSLRNRGVAAAVAAFEDAFGKTVVFFDNGSMKPGGLAFPPAPNFIGINVNSPISIAHLLGHELGHAIKRQDRNLYDSFQARILSLAKGREGYGRMLAERGYTEDKHADEMFNDIIGNLFRDNRFWQEVAGITTAKERRTLAGLANRIIGRMIGELRKMNARDATDNISDNLDAVRKGIAVMVSEYASRGNASAEIVTQEQAQPQNSPEYGGNTGTALFSSASQGSMDFGASGEMGDRTQRGLNFDSLPETGEKTQFQANAQKALDNAPTEQAKENVAKSVAKREGIKEPAAFVKAAIGAQASFNFGTTGSFGTKDQQGIDFRADRTTDTKPAEPPGILATTEET